MGWTLPGLLLQWQLCLPCCLKLSAVSLHAIQELPTLHELDAESMSDEISKATDALTCRKVPGNESILPEVIKLWKSALVGPLHKLLCLCWKERKLPQDMWDAKIMTLFKNKGDHSDCNNYHGISLLSIIGKFCLHSSMQTTDPCWPCLFQVPVQLQNQKVNSEYDLLILPAPREVLWAADASLHCLRWFEKSIWLMSRFGFSSFWRRLDALSAPQHHAILCIW